MEWCLTKKTCATVEIATALLDRVEGQEVEVEVLGVGITDIQSTRGKIEGSEIAGVVTKANEEMIIVGDELYSGSLKHSDGVGSV